MSETTPPPIAQQIASATQSLGKWISHGFKTVPDEVQAARLQLCHACEHYEPRAFGGMGRCLKCGCSSVKAALPWEKCPLDKWGPHPPPA